ncbi:hypothetical protein [Nocardia mexicana]|uniref:Excreted virulence factor EspC (Type VII ESX diderm) n=1 Tax=Nocardia mexicana TaxID=279262 RepID=A0A370HF40_9NOCA|nr:hypothetical protein [Nocardia mexicana]RDI55330.1 hypothetical protein DFR68_101163 [Nocardia mexicana]
MTEQRRVRVDTTRLRQAARKMDGVGGETTAIMSTLRNTLQGRGYPWGHDDYGDKFVTGEKGYENSSKNLLTGGDNLTGSAAKFSKGMSGAADKMDKMDSGA